MKLVDLLIKHNVQWPAGDTFVWQGTSGKVYWYGTGLNITRLPEVCDRDWNSDRCTKEQYDAALAKHKAKWVRNRGRKDVCPCDRTRVIEVRFRNKTTNANFKGSMWMWGHRNSTHDIMAWRYV